MNTEYIYLFEYSINEEYLHVEYWKKLGHDRKTIERSYRIILDKNGADEEEETLTNQELLLELKRRLREKRVLFNLQAENSEVDQILAQYSEQIDADLKDQESNFVLNLKEV